MTGGRHDPPAVRTGDAISFRMTVAKTDFWIDRVKKIRRTPRRNYIAIIQSLRCSSFSSFFRILVTKD